MAPLLPVRPRDFSTPPESLRHEATSVCAPCEGRATVAGRPPASHTPDDAQIFQGVARRVRDAGNQAGGPHVAVPGGAAAEETMSPFEDAAATNRAPLDWVNFLLADVQGG